jgi:plasmid maintenance system antidote protein VapI
VKEYSHDQVEKVIRERVARSSLRAVAREIGVSPAYLSDVLLGRRALTDRISLHFGFRKHVEVKTFFVKEKA